MIRRLAAELADEILLTDPVRPHIKPKVKNAPGREVYTLEGQAFVCTAFCASVPGSEEELLESKIGPICVPYTVWSLSKGRGRDIILALRDLMQSTYRVDRLVTLSPKSEEAKNFHLGLGASHLRETPFANNFEYELFFA